MTGFVVDATMNQVEITLSHVLIKRNRHQLKNCPVCAVGRAPITTLVFAPPMVEPSVLSTPSSIFLHSKSLLLNPPGKGGLSMPNGLNPEGFLINNPVFSDLLCAGR